MPQHPRTISVERFQGLNNILPPHRTPIEFLKAAVNIDIDDSGGISKRAGYTKVDSGKYHSVWSDGSRCYAVKNGDLVNISDGLEISTILAGVGEEKISFDSFEGTVYFSSIRQNGIITGTTVRSWGLMPPSRLPDISFISGSLKRGNYQLTITFVDTDGRESGSPVSQVINIPSDGTGLSVTNIPTSSDPIVEKVRLYMSTNNGSHLYSLGTVSNGTTATNVTALGGVVPLRSFNVTKAPLGHIVRYAHGRAWVAQDNILWYSEPFSPEWFKLQGNWFQFEERIRAVMPVPGGVWVAAEKLYYLSGKTPESMNMTEKEPIKVVEGTDVKILGAYLFIENTPLGFKWLVTSNRGVFACYNDGVVINLTERNVSYPEADQGAGVFVQTEGVNKYTTVLQKKRDSNNTVVGDMVSCTVIRNGVQITENEEL